MRALKRVAETEQTLIVMLAMVPRLLRDADWRRRTPDEGAGLGVLLVPGFGFGDSSLALASAWLRARGYRPAPARIGFNVACTSTLVDRIERRLDEHADRTGGRVVILGQSRGGWLGRLVAARRPDLARGLVTLGSPVLDPLGASPSVVKVAKTLARLSALGVPGLVNSDCFTGPCYESNSTALAEKLPPSVPALAVYSRLDRVAPWRLCQDPSAECVEIRSSHTAMGLHPDFYRTLRPRLASWAARDDHAASPETAMAAKQEVAVS